MCDATTENSPPEEQKPTKWQKLLEAVQKMTRSGFAAIGPDTKSGFGRGAGMSARQSMADEQQAEEQAFQQAELDRRAQETRERIEQQRADTESRFTRSEKAIQGRSDTREKRLSIPRKPTVSRINQDLPGGGSVVLESIGGAPHRPAQRAIQGTVLPDRPAAPLPVGAPRLPSSPSFNPPPRPTPPTTEDIVNAPAPREPTDSSITRKGKADFKEAVDTIYTRALERAGGDYYKAIAGIRKIRGVPSDILEEVIDRLRGIHKDADDY